MNAKTIQKSSKDLIDTLLKLNKDKDFLKRYDTLIDNLLNAINTKNTIFFCGNGGSFADAQHLAAELVVRFKENRRAINSIALGSNQCNLTAIGNDFEFEDIFVRELSALYKEGDIVIILSTSGNSKNLVKVANYLINNGSKGFSILGKSGGLLKDLTHNIVIPSKETATIQEVTIVIGHSLCTDIDKHISFNK